VSARRPVAIVVHAYYDEDARIRRHVDALVAGGREVDVFALRRPDDEPVGREGAVTVHRLPVGRHQGASLPVYLGEYAAFAGAALWRLALAHRRRRYAVVHVATIPDFLVFAALPLRLVGVPVILDLHEAMPEFFRSRFPAASGRIPLALLHLQERLAVGFASAALTVNDALRDRLVALGVPAGKITVTLNTPSLAMFDPAAHPARAFAGDGTVRLVYAGALTPIYELDVLVAAVGVLAARRPDLRVELDVFGRGDSSAALEAQVAELGLEGRVRLNGRIPLEAVPAAIAAADIGIAPTRRDQFTDISLSTKVFEYGAMAKPVVASSLPTVARYFPGDEVTTYEPGSPEALAAAVEALVDDEARRDARVERMTLRVRELSWEHEAARYRALVDRLEAGRRGSGHGPG
jgi:glycosyltransferase involved in cell wall biosynthesis